MITTGKISKNGASHYVLINRHVMSGEKLTAGDIIIMDVKKNAD
jgi:hypothetical protein